MIRGMRIACQIPNATNTFRLCNRHRFSTATMVARTRLNVTLYVHCLPCLCIEIWLKSIFCFEFDVNYRYSIMSIAEIPVCQYKLCEQRVYESGSLQISPSETSLPVKSNCKLYVYIVKHNYTGCPGRNVPDFGRMFLKLKYTDITQNTYIQS